MSEVVKDFASGQSLNAVGGPADYDHVRSIEALAESQTDHAAIERFRERHRQSQLLSIPQPMSWPLPTSEAARGALTSARGNLRQAINARKVAERDLGSATDALQRGQEAAEVARAQLANLGDVDHLIAAWRAGRIAAGKPAEPLPDDFEHNRIERDRLQREIADSTRTVGILTGHVADAEQTLTKAKAHVDEAVAGVLDANAALLALRLVRHQEEAFELLRRLTALGDVVIGGRHFKTPNHVAQALQADSRPWQSISPGDRDIPRREWLRIVAALTADAGAPLNAEADCGT